MNALLMHVSMSDKGEEVLLLGGGGKRVKSAEKAEKRVSKSN